jgi:AcrR family transcriptional regulator
MTQPYHHGALRTALLNSAEAILDRDGIGALTLRAAAREAGVSHAAPTHHFGDLTGLLTELAASGFVRFRTHLQAEAATAGQDPNARLIALGRGYVGFARACPGLFQLMFRSERLDWSSPALSTAGAAAFALLTQDEAEAELQSASYGFQNLVVAMSRWSLVHGLSMLLIDGRLGAFADQVPGADIEVLIEQVLTRLVLQEPGIS